MQKGPVTPKGFGDIFPEIASKRKDFINKISVVLEKYGFKPLETPTVEFAETLLGKYGEEEKLIYTFEDKGGRKLALRYDLTVPLARFVSNNLGLLNPTFARYQIGQVFRGEKPQKGRSREFTQFDCDIIGSSDVADDCKVIASGIDGIRAIGFKKAMLAINDRGNFNSFSIEDIRLIDKMYKIGKDKMPANLLDFIEKSSPTPRLKEIFKMLESDYKLKENKDFFFDPTLARGLDYYTSTVFEMKLSGDPADLSVGGGGRYDNLIGMFAGCKIPAVGFSFGIDRIVELTT
ncbi:MAG: histidyl-tRNA synthetase [uncultured bacterium]|nr:MAG: histidyl-tRNA synthetase [uncultured bacterium]